MNILRLIGSMDPVIGGPCEGIRNSIAELAKTGVHNEVVCLDSPDASYLGEDAFLIHALGPSKGLWQYSARLLPWLVEHLPRFDVVIVHGLWLYPSFAAHLAVQQVGQRKPSPKLFIMPHGMLDPWFQATPTRRLKSIRNWLYWKLIEHKVIQGADALLFTSKTELLLAREPFQPYQPKHEINIGYGIKSPPPYTAGMRAAFQERCPELGKRPYLLFLSRIHEKKGVDLLLKAYLHLAQNWSEDIETLPQLVVAGPGSDSGYGLAMKALATEITTAVRNAAILFPGMLKGEAKWGAFYGCEAFVLPSHQENFGIAVAEAMGCNKPVLTSTQVNIWQEIADGEGGLVAEDTLHGTQQMLQQWAVLSPSDKIKMGEKAKVTFDKHFTIYQAVARLKEAIYQHDAKLRIAELARNTTVCQVQL